MVFNGGVGALTGKNAMTANVGETVMIVHSQANRDTRPHLIGGHGDYVWETGKFANRPEVDLETWFIRGGSAGAALYTFKQPGIYAYVNHNLIEAVELGAAAHFKVEGKWNDDLMKQVRPPEAIPPKVQGALQPRFEGELRLRWSAGSTIRQTSFRMRGDPCCSRRISRVFLAAAGFAVPLAMTSALPGGNRDIAAIKDQPALVELQPGTLRYRVAGDFTRAGKPAEAPLATIRIAQPLTIMKHQVSSAEYQRCVSEGACRALPADIAIAADRPAVMVSWRDADAYATWLSRRTGYTYRLPTDEEWAYAAGSRYQDDGLPVDDSDPSKRWLARYEREADLKKRGDRRRSPADRRLRRQRERLARRRRQCLGMDQHLFRAHGARRDGKGSEHDGELRRARGRGPAPRLRDRLHPRCARRRMRGGRSAQQSRVPAGARVHAIHAMVRPLARG